MRAGRAHEARGGLLNRRGVRDGGIEARLVGGTRRRIPAPLQGQRPRGACLGAVAARLAIGRAPVRPERRGDQHVRPAHARLQAVVARGGVAGADAALTLDAQVGIVRQEGVALHRRQLVRPVDRRGRLHPQLGAEPRELVGPLPRLARRGGQRRALAREDQLQCELAVGGELGRIGRDLHAVAHRRRAGGHGMRLALDLDHADAA